MTKIIGTIFTIFGFIGILIVCIYDNEHSSYISIGSWFMLGIRMLVDGGSSD